MIDRVDGDAIPGDIVAVYDRRAELFGYGLYNPRSEIVIRMLVHGANAPGAAFWQTRLEQAVALRRDLLRLDSVSDAYRIVHAEADGISGWVVDRFADVLSAQAYSIGTFQRSVALIERLAPLSGTEHSRVDVDVSIHGREGFLAEPIRSRQLPDRTTIREYDARFYVDFTHGHKTGFFCDQRENRRRLAELADGRSLLDLCCYTGGFAIQAKKQGALEVTGVDLDENAIEVARQNARLNQLRVSFVHADIFAYMRDMLQNGRQYDVVVLDPPKLIRSRREIDEGKRVHFDMNRLAMQLVRPGGLLLSCSCSGLLAEEDFLQLLHAAARQAGRPETAGAPSSGRRLQILAKTGAAADHPVAPNCPETAYLKAVWMRVTEP